MNTPLKKMNWIIFLFIVLLSSFNSIQAPALPPPTSTAGISTTWVNAPPIARSITLEDGTTLRPLLSIWREDGDKITQIHCGFAGNGTAGLFLFAIFVYGFPAASRIKPQILWSANRNNPIKENGTLELTYNGDLVLKDADGTVVWSSGTSNKNVAGLSILDTGNLVILNEENVMVWQSFDHPTDTLLIGQRLVAGQRLSASNWTTGNLFMEFSQHVLGAFVDSNPPQMYFTFGNYSFDALELLNGSLRLFTRMGNDVGKIYNMPSPSSVQFLRMDSDGHFRLYEWSRYEWKVMNDFFSIYLFDDCNYPTVCGSYGICSNGQCACPNSLDGQSPYYEPINARQVNLGCREVTPLSCEQSQYHHLLGLENITSFNYIDANAVSMVGTDMETCKKACLRNCSCKAGLFKYLYNDTYGNCYLPSQVFSLKNMQEHSTFQSAAFLKVKTVVNQTIQTNTTQTNATHKVKIVRTRVLVIISIVSSIVALFVCSCIWYVKTKIHATKEKEEYFDNLLDMPIRFTYADLKSMTDNFNRRIGEGGFGAVFEGTAVDGTKVAVKQLDSISQGTKEFLAEVKCIGCIHHFNLVRLIGFCAETSHKLLVYEYMSNGSLDKWLFHDGGRPFLTWQIRQKIILQITKGLQYLHEECRHKIAHLDVKPQNILLDDKFNAKLSDFGLSKLIERELSHVITSVRGTLGYLAPEWLGKKITEKVDVYSFGVVILEIVCGRKVLDYSLPEEDIHLLSVLKRKAEEGNLTGMINVQGEKMGLHVEEALKMIEIAVWCLQADCSKRPSMSMVVRVLEGLSELDVSLDYTLLTLDDAWTHRVSNLYVSAPPQASILPGPR